MKKGNYTQIEIDEYIRNLQDPYARLSFEVSEKEYIRLLQNPYAILSINADSDGTENRKSINIKIIRLSKREFDKGCRNIFYQYLPLHAKKELLPEHKDFIDRNINKIPEDRALLLHELRKYDLSNNHVTTYFNREGNGLTKAKLRKIEKKIDSAK